MKNVIILLSCLSLLQAILWAKQNQKEALPCGQNYTKKITQGDKKALRNYIEECHKKPSETLLRQYQVQKYTTMHATSLVCMGDYYATRITHLSYLAYTLAAKQESLAAKVSLGVMLTEPRFKEKLPLSTSHQKKYQRLAQEEHPYNHYETLLQLRNLDNKKEIKNYKKRHHTNIIKYANDCITSLQSDIIRVKNKVKVYQKIMQRKRDHDVELWADTEFHFAQTKQQRLEKALNTFKTIASTK